MQSARTSATSNKPTAEPQKLSRETIAQAAMDMADEIGVENVSARKLAQELNVTAMALYRYYDSIDDIRVAAAALSLTEVDAHPIPGERWDDTLRRTMASIRENGLRHAKANFYAVEGAGDSPAAQAHTQRIYALHQAQGFPADILRKTWRIVDAYLNGFIQAEIRDMQRQVSDAPQPEEEWLKTAAGAYSEETFHDGIDIIIAGVRAMAAPDPCDWRTPEQ